MSGVLIEFFDKSPLENLISSLIIKPEKIIFLGANHKQMERKRDTYQRFLALKNIDAEIIFRGIKKNDLEKISRVIEDIAENNVECVVDLTGGEELALVALGMAVNKLKERRFTFHCVSINSQKVIEFFNDNQQETYEDIFLTVEETVLLNGGAMVRLGDTDDDFGSVSWDFNDEFVSDVEMLWELCKSNCVRWNIIVRELSNYITGESLTVNATGLADPAKHKRLVPPWTWGVSMLRKIQNTGVICRLQQTGDGFQFAFKNEMIMKIFEKAGTILELKTYLLIKQIKETSEKNYYDDVEHSVCIDWDGVVHECDAEIKDTRNEIDVVAMKGLIPYFISCKNGMIEDEELYKLSTVAERFGGSYARKALVATYVGKSQEGMESFRQRAKDMQITLIEGVHEITDEAFCKKLKNL